MKVVTLPETTTWQTTATAAEPDAYQVRQCRTGLGLFATRKIPAGTCIVSGIPLSTSRHRTSTSFEVDRGMHVELSHPASLINHACLPNLSVKDNAFGGFDFITLHPIEAGEQLRSHYGMHEWRSTAVHKCKCGYSQCHGRAQGYAELSREDRDIITTLGAARHLVETDPDAPPRGLHATIALSGIHAGDVPKDNPTGRNRIRLFLDQLVRVIGMNPHGEPRMDYYPTDGSQREGWTGVQLITTSSVTLHLYRAGSAWVDITSCQPFEVTKAAQWCQEKLKAGSYRLSTMELT